MVRWLRVFVALVQGMNLVLSTHMVAGDPTPSSGLCGHQASAQ